MDEAMNLLLPMVQSIMGTALINDLSLPSLAMQRIILKTFFALTQVGQNFLGAKASTGL